MRGRVDEALTRLYSEWVLSAAIQSGVLRPTVHISLSSFLDKSKEAIQIKHLVSPTGVVCLTTEIALMNSTLMNSTVISFSD